MNFSFLMLVVILILFFIIKQLKNDGLNYTKFLIISLLVLLVIYEIYMTLGYNKMESFDSIVKSNFKLNYPVNRVTKMSLSPLAPYTTQVPVGKFGYISIWSYRILYNSGKLFLLNNVMADNSRLIIVIDTDNNNTVSTMEIDNEYKAVSEDNLINLNNRYYNASCTNADITMIAGGCDIDSKKVSDTVSIYDHKWLVWTKDKLSKPRYMMNAIEYDGKFYFICGLKEDTEISETIDIYDTKFKHSTIKTPFKGRIHMNVEAYDSKLYLIGGYDGESYVNRVDIYDINNDKWVSITVPNLLNIATKIMNDKLFIATSSNVNNEYQHTYLEPSNTRVPDGMLYNGINISKMSDNIIDTAKSIAFWINIPKEYVGKTHLIMKSGNSGIALHNDQLVPVFFLDGYILIKNTNVTKIEYGKWIHLVFNKSLTNVSPTTVSPTTVSPTTASPTTASPITASPASHEIAIYIDGQLTEYPINFNLEYNDGITLTGYKIFTENNIDYPKMGLISNIKEFNRIIEFSTISDIYNMEYSMYNGDINYSFRALDLKTLKLSTPSMNIDKRDYKNLIMESYKGRYLIIVLNYLNDDDTIDTIYYKYDTLKNTGKNIEEINIYNHITTASVESDNGVIMGGYNDEEYSLTFISIDDIMTVPLVNCIAGEKRINNECVSCEVDTYSTEVNATKCDACPKNTSTDTKKGQSKCNITPEFTNKTIYHPIDNNFQQIINDNNTAYDKMKKINDDDDVTIAAFQNNLDLALRL